MDKRIDKYADELKALCAAYKDTFESESGRIVLEDLKKVCFYGDSTIYDDNKIDPLSVVLREGLRRVVLRITNYMSWEKVSNELKKLRQGE